MVEKEATTEENNMVRFFRSQLETIVWDRERNKVLADFSKGFYTTDDEREIKILRKLGYPEIPLDLENPPDNVIVVQAPAPPRRTNELEGVNETIVNGTGYSLDGHPAPIGGGKVPLVRVKPGQ